MAQQKKKTVNNKEHLPTRPAHQTEVGSENEHALGSVIFDRFEVFGVRRGGQGTVYLVEEIHSHEKYAVKTFPTFLQNKSSENLQKIPDELDALTKIPFHNNIVSPLSVEYINEYPYIFMEYIPTSLRERIGKLSFEEGVDLAYQICCAMDFINNMRTTISVVDQPERLKRVQKGYNFPKEWRDESREILISEEGLIGTPGRTHMIHGDLKPENVLISEDGVGKVSDFGMAHLFDFASGSFVQQTHGTVPYMSPEQLRGEALDERSDVFSFGVMFYEMLRGSLPYPFDLLKLNSSKWRTRLNNFYNEVNTFGDLTPPWEGIQNPSESYDINELVFCCLFTVAGYRFPNFRAVRRRFESLGIHPQKVAQEDSKLKAADKFRRALLLHKMGKAKDALDMFNNALILDPNNPRFWTEAAFALNDLGEKTLAENILSQAKEMGFQNVSDKK